MSHGGVDAEKDALFLQSIVENIPYMIFVKDARDLRFVRFNKTGEELLGYSRQQLIGKNDYDFFPKEEADFFTQQDRRVLDGKIVVDIPEEPIQTKTQGLRYLHTKKIPILDEHGVPRYLLGISQDITEIKKVHAELHRAKEDAEAANRAKTDFLAKMSHEIRTPMNGIIGMTELALETQLNAEQQEYLTLVRDSAESLLTVLNDILDFSKIETGKLGMESAPFDLRGKIGQIVKTYVVRAERKGLELTTDFAEDLPMAVLGDSVRLRQILVNLLDNAVRFTESGRIVVSARVKEHTETATVVQFSVSDTGIGIGDDQRDVIFEAFTQADGSTTRKYGGTGLGLTISARLVEMMGGHIWLEAEPGIGSTFHFTAELGRCASIRLRDERTSSATLAMVPRLQPLRVLVAEDNLVNLLLTERILESEGHAVEVAHTGTQAIGAFKRAPFDLVFMDVEMPDMGGFEATRRIREIEKTTGSHTPIVALTAHAMPGYRERCIEAGMDGYLAKPIRRAVMLAALARALPDRVAAKAGLERDPELPTNTRKELFDTFVSTTRRDVEELESAIARSEWKRVGVIAHGVAGAAHIMGAREAGSLAERLYAVSQSGDLAGAKDLVRSLLAAVDALRQS